VTEGTTGRPAILVSACLLGVRCDHRGGASPSDAARALGATHRLVPICPKTAGGLPTPRSPSCGCDQVYDGTFRRTLVAGEGVTAEALRRAGLRLRSDEDLEAG